MRRLKAIAPLAALATVLGVGSARAQAEERVILLEEQAAPPRESLVQALRIQLSGLASLEREALAPGEDPRPHAERRADEPGALAVLWLPTGSTERAEVTELHAVGRSQSGVRHEQVRVAGGARPDVERSLALKVREWVHALRRSRAAVTNARDAAADEADAGAGRPASAGDVALVLSGGARVAPLSTRAQWGAAFAAGVAVRPSALRLVGGLELAWSPETELARGPLRATVEELAPGLFARAELRQGDLWLGAHTGLSLSLVHAEGSDGRERGDARVSLASARVGLHVELEVGRGFGLHAGLGLQLRLRRQRFTVAGVELIDFGRLRPAASLALAWRWPSSP